MSKQGGRFVPYKKNNDVKNNNIKQKDRKTEAKPTETCRHVFSLNFSGTKQLILSHDVSQDFAPVITIEKTGSTGIRLSEEAFKMLCVSKDFINEYFSQEELSNRQDIISLTSNEVLELKQQWGNNLAVLKNKHDAANQVTIAKTTWDNLDSLLPLLQYMLEKMCYSQNDYMKLFVACAQLLKKSLPVEYSIPNSPYINEGVVLNTIKNMQLSDLQLDVQDGVDYEQMFLEMRCVCFNELFHYMYYV
jgi:hypothetical protein